MNADTLKVTGLALAVLGSIMMVEAKPGGEGSQDGKKKGHRPSKEQMMERFDTDGNGELSESEREAMREEIRKHRGEHAGERPSREEILNKFDADGDGELNEEERAALREAMGERRSRRGPPPAEVMEKFDIDGDGELSEEERAAMREAHGNRGKKKDGKKGGEKPDA